jgi:hypothetical protein
MPKTGTSIILRMELRNPITKALEDAPAESLSLFTVDANGVDVTVLQAAITHDGTGLYHNAILSHVTGL